MSMSALVRALGAAAGGVSSGMDAAEAAAERKRLRDEAVEDRKFTMSERTRALNLRDELGRAAATVAPVEIKQDRPDSMDDRDVGGAGEAPLPTAGYDVAGKRFATKDEAMTAAAAANTPQAVTTRMSDVLMRNGDPVQAQKLRVGAMQEQVGKFQLNDAMRADLDAQWNQEVDNKVTDWKTMAQFYSDSAADGVGGKNKYQFLPSPDGKSQVAHLVLADGALKPTEKTFPNTADGFAVAKAEMKRMPAERVLMHFFQKNQLAKQAERDAATAKYHEGMLKISQQNADTNEQYRRDQAAALKAKADAAGGPGGMTMADLKEGHKSIAATLNADWKTQIESETDPAKLKAIKTSRENEIATVQRLYTGAMQAGFAMTPEQAIVAFRSGEKAQQKFKARDGSGTVTKEGILYGGRFIPLADNPGASPGAAEPPSSMAEAIRRDAEKTGTTDFVVNINGRTQAYGNAKLPGEQGGAPSMTDRVATPDPAPAPAAPADLAERMKAEQTEMGNGTRTAYTPEVAAYVKKLAAEKDAAAAEKSRKAREEERKKAMRDPAMAQVRRDAASVK